ncbi:hypothetical protein C8R48DRAFT_117520 [Suillus tomentosus]|nr:hypothetical protein C8R48DRAFT_117520 [Suillus tomentosus]
MVQCLQAHIFCKGCMSSYASNLLGERNPYIVCMDQSGCKLLFPQSELEHFLTLKLLELYHCLSSARILRLPALRTWRNALFTIINA